MWGQKLSIGAELQRKAKDGVHQGMHLVCGTGATQGSGVGGGREGGRVAEQTRSPAIDLDLKTR